MPKIIEHIERLLLEEARRQIETDGYSAMTIRSVAKACGVGVGTVYNYFPSKDALLAVYLLEDWEQCIATIHAASAESDQPRTLLRCMYDQLVTYAQAHETIFRDESTAGSFSGSFSKYHGLLRTQLAQPIRRFCQTDFEAEFVAESLLVWSMSGKPFGEIFSVLEKLF